MNVVISGPFGRGMLSDEIVLAGLLRHLAHGKHHITVFSANPVSTTDMHASAYGESQKELLQAVKMSEPSKLLSTPEAWTAMNEAQLMILASAGVFSQSDKSKSGAYAWLAPLEHAQRVGVKTAVIGIGALQIADRLERVRMQRLLHNCVDSISVRDSDSKQAVMTYGLSANRISNNGDPALALTRPFSTESKERRVGVILSGSVPSRSGFSTEPITPGYELTRIVQNFFEKLISLEPQLKVLVFHDNTSSGEQLADIVESVQQKSLSSNATTKGNVDEDFLVFQESSLPINETQATLETCGAIFSFSLHGLLLGATSGVPVAGLASESGASALLNSLGLGQYSVASPQGKESEPEALGVIAATAVYELLGRQAELQKLVRERVRVLTRKEAQNARMLELLVPRRQRPRAGMAESTDLDE